MYVYILFFLHIKSDEFEIETPCNVGLQMK